MISSVTDLYVQNQERKRQSHQIYKTMYVDVLHKIQEKHNNHVYNLIYKPPMFVYGNIRFNRKTCFVYLVKKLSRRGFLVFIYKGNLLYIDWSYILSIKPTHSNSNESIQNKKSIKQVTFSADR